MPLTRHSTSSVPCLDLPLQCVSCHHHPPSHPISLLILVPNSELLTMLSDQILFFRVPKPQWNSLKACLPEQPSQASSNWGLLWCLALFNFRCLWALSLYFWISLTLSCPRSCFCSRASESPRNPTGCFSISFDQSSWLPSTINNPKSYLFLI